MKGRIYIRKDLVNTWYYVQWYDQRTGKHIDIRHYFGMRMYDKRYAAKLLAMIQGDWERSQRGEISFSIEKYTKKQTDVIPFLHNWLDIIKDGLSLGTWKNYLSYTKNHLEPYFEKHPTMLDEINLMVLLKLKKSLDLTPKGKWNVMAAFHSALDFAYRTDLIKNIPPFPKKGEYAIQDPVVKWLPEDRQMNIITAMPERHRPIFLFLKYHYRRPAEAMVLKREDYNPSTRSFTICRGISYGQEVQHTKTKKNHHIPCHPEFRKILENMVFKYAFSPYMFTCDEAENEHKRYTKNTLLRVWKEACQVVGEDIDLYSGLKHSSCTQLIMLGASPEEVKVLTDHSSSKSVEKYLSAELATKMAVMQKVISLRDKKAGIRNKSESDPKANKTR